MQKSKQLLRQTKKSWRSFQKQKQQRGTNKKKKVVCATSKRIERSCRSRERPAIQVHEGGNKNVNDEDDDENEENDEDHEIDLMIFQAIYKE